MRGGCLSSRDFKDGVLLTPRPGPRRVWRGRPRPRTVVDVGASVPARALWEERDFRARAKTVQRRPLARSFTSRGPGTIGRLPPRASALIIWLNPGDDICQKSVNLCKRECWRRGFQTIGTQTINLQCRQTTIRHLRLKFRRLRRSRGSNPECRRECRRLPFFCCCFRAS